MPSPSYQKAKSDVERIKPRQKLEAEFRRQLGRRKIYVNAGVNLGFTPAKLSELEAYFWRDIDRNLSQGYDDAIALAHALDSLREKIVFVDALDDLVERFSVEADLGDET